MRVTRRQLRRLSVTGARSRPSGRAEAFMTTAACHQARLFTTRASSPLPQLLSGSTVLRSLPLRPSSTSLKRPFHSTLRRPVDPRNNPSSNTDDTPKSNASSAAGAAKDGKSKDLQPDKTTDQPTSTESTKTDEPANNEAEPPSGWKLSQQKRRARGTPREGWLAAPPTPEIGDELLDEILIPYENDGTDIKKKPIAAEVSEEKSAPMIDEEMEKLTARIAKLNAEFGEFSKTRRGGVGPSDSPSSSDDRFGLWKVVNEQPMLTKDIGRYKVSRRVLVEISTMIDGGLSPSNGRYIDTTAGKKPHIMLHCPQDGGFFFLDAVVRQVSRGRADLVVLDAQQIARAAEKFHQGDFTTAHNALWTLGYATHAHLNSTMKKSESKTQDYFEDMDEPPEEDENASNEEPLGFPKSNNYSRYLSFYQTTDLSKLFAGGSTGTSTGKPFRPSRHTEDTQLSGTTAWIEALLDKVVERRKAKDAEVALTQSQNPDSTSNDERRDPLPEHHNIIVQVSDFASMFSKPAGRIFIDKLLAVVQKRRKAGERIIVIGTHASEDDTRNMTFKTLYKWQVDPAHTRLQAVIVPCANEDSQKLLKDEYRDKILAINKAHLETMVRQQASSSAEAARIIEDLATNMERSLCDRYWLTDYVWRYEEIHRLATRLLGRARRPIFHELLSKNMISSALLSMRTSDIDKMRFIVERNPASAPEKPSSDRDGKEKSKSDDKDKQKGPDLKAIRKDCNKYESKLLNGVVNSADIKTTFSDVHVTPATIDALKTLTTLSLIRPEAFTYGVLSSDKIPGLLLYGPPGTGKTLLAKAVAKESGATVLEISGSDIYDMYVGEGEKNVRAIFSLAKKLSPCVIFIDEADSIFGSRTNSRNRNTHRELINQFLREWDGMHNSSAFIMVATNRPFDLDDAVLRRLPRRILVDLPTEKDREEILNIHLKDEQLSEVSIPDLASKTPFYSGSDLKNVCVAAALAAVKDENALAAAHDGPEPYVYPAKRILLQKHFDKALEEISASISEDMGSLTAIRKFDERYGDGAGRKKRGKGLGFGMLKEGERERLSEEDSRVRKLVVN